MRSHNIFYSNQCNETDRNTTRCFKQILWFQTWVNATFSVFIPPSSQVSRGSSLRPSKRKISWTCYLLLRVTRKFSKAFSYQTCVFADLLMVIGIRSNKQKYHPINRTVCRIRNIWYTIFPVWLQIWYTIWMVEISTKSLGL